MNQNKQDWLMAQKYLQLLYVNPTSYNVFFQTLAENDKSQKHLNKAFFGDSVKKCKEHLIRLNNQGAGVFVTLNSTDGKGRKKENITTINAILIENDGDAHPIEDMKPHMVVQSSIGKYHYYYCVDGITHQQYLQLMQVMIKYCGSDKNVKDLPRLIRVPGFYHNKGEPFLTKLEEYNPDLPRYTYGDFEECLGDKLEGATESKKKLTALTASKKSKDYDFHDFLKAMNALSYIDVCDYNDWIETLMIIHNVFDELLAYEIAHLWSALCYSYRPEEVDAKLKSFRR